MNKKRQLSRREFGKTTLVGAGVVVQSTSNSSAQPKLPRRRLGKTDIEVGILGLGSAPLGAPEVSQAEVNRVIDACIEAGINYLDTAPIYRMAERRLGHALKGKRDQFVLVTKVEANSRADAMWFVRESLMKLQTDYLDLVHLHNVGRTDRYPDLDSVYSDQGALDGLRRLKQQGLIRHIGLTTHMRPGREMPILDTGDIEVVMSVANFVERHIYNWEEGLFAVARKRGLGIVGMKILGGQQGDGARLSAPEHYQDAVRYALSIPGLSVALMGVKSVPELNRAVETVLAHKPFSDQELSRISEKGRQMASEWGEVRGPVALA